MNLLAVDRLFAFSRFAFLPAVLIAAAGCGGAKGPSVSPVAGKVLVDGKPATAAIVTLHPVAPSGPDAVRPSGVADDAGAFKLTSFTAGDGAPPGEYKVTVSWFQVAPARKGAGDGDVAPPRSLLPPTYSNPDSTPLRATVRPGANDPLAIEIKRH